MIIFSDVVVSVVENISLVVISVSVVSVLLSIETYEFSNYSGNHRNV